jgi:hypothetical protein
MSKNVKFVQGNEACAEAALYAGLDFYAGYPITPSSEITEYLAYRLPQIGGKFMQMEDEIASLCAIIGASLTGCKVMTATSGPGFSLMQEALGYAIMAEIPCVIVDVQRGGPSTGLPTHGSQGDINQARWGTHGDHAIIALTASNHQDVFSITVEAFNLAETYRTPVIVLLDEVVAHMRERLVIPESGEIALADRLSGKMADCPCLISAVFTASMSPDWSMTCGVFHPMIPTLSMVCCVTWSIKSKTGPISYLDLRNIILKMPSIYCCLTDLQPVPLFIRWKIDNSEANAWGCWNSKPYGHFRKILCVKNVLR